jgi:iron(III) transport system permease protein
VSGLVGSIFDITQRREVEERLGRNGLFAKIFHGFGVEIPGIYGWKGIVLVFTLQFFPFVFLMVSAAINAIDRSLKRPLPTSARGNFQRGVAAIA